MVSIPETTKKREALVELGNEWTFKAIGWIALIVGLVAAFITFSPEVAEIEIKSAIAGFFLGTVYCAVFGLIRGHAKYRAQRAVVKASYEG